MTTPRSWPGQLTEIAGAQIKRHRQAQKLTTEQLAARVTSAGFKCSRDQVVNLERKSGRRQSITVGEIIIFAAVLGLPPAVLLIPIGSSDPVEYLPGRGTDAWAAYQWFTGSGSDALVGDAWFPTQLDEATLQLNVYRRHTDAVRHLDAAAQRGESSAAEGYRAAVAAIRNEIRAHGWHPPSLPLTVNTMVEQAEEKVLRPALQS